MSLGSVDTSDATKQEYEDDTRYSDPFEHDARRSLFNVKDADAAAAQDARSGARHTEQQHGMDAAGMDAADIVAYFLPTDSFWSACEWCCRPALPAANVCGVHRMTEKEEAQREWNITGYKRFREDQLKKKYAETKTLENRIRDKMRHEMDSRLMNGDRDSDSDRDTRRMGKEIRSMQKELQKRREKIREWEQEKERERQWENEMGSRYPVPSRKTIVRAYHGKIKTYSSRDPACQNGIYAKNCGCPDYRPLSIGSNYV